MLPPDKIETPAERYVRQCLAAINRRASECQQQSLIGDLKSIIHDWWSSLPPITRNRRFSMQEIVGAALDRSGHRYSNKDTAAALERLGWATGRDWTRAGRNRRFWMPPQPR